MAKENKEAHIDEKMEEAVEVADETVEVADEETTETTASVEPVQLQINDLQGLGQIINLACKRGAFEAAEMETIGASYNKLNAFLGYVAAQASQAKTEETAADAPETK
jgi:hypothetical protein